MFLCLLIMAAVLVVALHVMTRHRWARPAQRWFMAAVCGAVSAVMLYVWGLFALHQFLVELEDICQVRYGENFDPAYGQVSLWPVGRRCNEHFDMVPGFVTPAILGLSAGAVVCATLALRARGRRLSH